MKTFKLEKSLKKFFSDYNTIQILNSGVLFMFDTKLTVQEHDKIKKQFISMLQDENLKQQQEKIIDESCFEDETLHEIINLKLKSK